MSHRDRLIFGLVLLLATGVAQTLGATPPHVVAGGGGVAEGGNRRLHGTVGQYAIGRFTPVSGGPVTLGAIGFWYLAAVGDPGPPSDVPEPIRGNRLEQNVPNPFNPSTTISFAIEATGPVRLRLFDLRGQTVATLIDGELPAGAHSLVFSPTTLASGVYFYRLETGTFVETRRLLLLK